MLIILNFSISDTSLESRRVDWYMTMISLCCIIFCIFAFAANKWEKKLRKLLTTLVHSFQFFVSFLCFYVCFITHSSLLLCTSNSSSNISQMFLHIFQRLHHSEHSHPKNQRNRDRQRQSRKLSWTYKKKTPTRYKRNYVEKGEKWEKYHNKK